MLLSKDSNSSITKYSGKWCGAALQGPRPLNRGRQGIGSSLGAAAEDQRLEGTTFGRLSHGGQQALRLRLRRQQQFRLQRPLQCSRSRCAAEERRATRAPPPAARTNSLGASSLEAKRPERPFSVQSKTVSEPRKTTKQQAEASRSTAHLK